MRHPIDFTGTYHTSWNGYYFKEKLGYTSGLHTGVDYNWGSGDDDFNKPVHAIVSGTVVAKINSGQVSGFGNAVIIQTAKPPVAGNNLYHRYLHMNSVSVSVGQKVSEGQEIGKVGKTGTTLSHLHLDTWTDRNGLGVHWNYDKDTALLSYEDAFRLIENNKSWTGADMALTRQNVIDEYQANRGSNPSEAEIATHLNGGTWQSMSLGFKSENATRKASYEKQIATLNTTVANQSKQIEALNAQILGLTQTVNEKQAEIDTLQDEVNNLKKENAELKTLLVQTGSDTLHLNALGELLNWFIQRLGLRK